MPSNQFHTFSPNSSHRAASCCAAALIAASLTLQAGAQCEPIVNGDFNLDLDGWTVDPLTTHTGDAVAQATAGVVSNNPIGPPLIGPAAVLSASAHALGGRPGLPNQALTSVTLSTNTVVSDRFLTFDGFGSWEMLRSGAGSGTYEFHAQVENGDGEIAARTFAILNSPPPLICGMGMSILGIVASDGPFAVDVFFNDENPTGIEIGDEVTLRLTVECSAGAVTECDETDFGIAVFVDNFQFCALPVGCPDLTGDNQVGVDDLLAVITSWGACPLPPGACAADTNHDGLVNVDDLLAVITNWGPCG